METPRSRLLRFADLRDRKIVSNWPQLKRLIQRHGFPRGYWLSPGVHVFDEPAVEAWIQEQRDKAVVEDLIETLGA